MICTAPQPAISFEKRGSTPLPSEKKARKDQRFSHTHVIKRHHHVVPLWSRRASVQPQICHCRHVRLKEVGFYQVEEGLLLRKDEGTMVAHNVADNLLLSFSCGRGFTRLSGSGQGENEGGPASRSSQKSRKATANHFHPIVIFSYFPPHLLAECQCRSPAIVA